MFVDRVHEDLYELPGSSLNLCNEVKVAIVSVWPWFTVSSCVKRPILKKLERKKSTKIEYLAYLLYTYCKYIKHLFVKC